VIEIVDRLDQLRATLDVLQHPFYQRWSAGELAAGELAVYAGEYRGAVLALADASERAAAEAPPQRREGLRRHAAEERAHVGLWDAFAEAAGAPAGEHATQTMLPGTRTCAQAWTAGDELLEHLAVLYVVEAGQPEISRTKLDGLIAHYGFSAEGPATEYFRVHERLDVEHARQAAALIDELIAEADDAAAHCARMLPCAEAALRGNWLLLDDVQARAHS